MNVTERRYSTGLGVPSRRGLKLFLCALCSEEFSRQEYWSGLPFLPPGYHGIIWTQGPNVSLQCLLYYRQILYLLSYWESPFPTAESVKPRTLLLQVLGPQIPIYSHTRKEIFSLHHYKFCIQEYFSFAGSAVISSLS